MKKTLFLLSIMVLFSITGVFAALTDLDFVSSIGTYNEITGGSVLGGITNDDENFIDPVTLTGAESVQTGIGFPIGFNFAFNDNIFDRFAVNSNGWIKLGTGTFTIGYTISPMGSTTVAGFSDLLVAHTHDLGGQTDSELSFLTEGVEPNRVCVVQWKNYRHYVATGDNYNFQIRLYETSNKIEFVYGPFTCNTTSRTAQVGLRGVDNTDYVNRTTTTDWAATTAGTTNVANCTLSATVFPANGLTFAYTVPNPVLPPNPANCVSPVNAGTNIAVDAALNWASGGGIPTGYRLNFGTNNPPTNIVNNQDLGLVTTYDPDLQYTTTYYWQVVPYNANGPAENCPIWSFSTPSVTVPPEPAVCVSPVDAATNVAPYAVFNWTMGGGYPTGCRLNFGTDNPPTNIANNQDLGLVTTYDPSPDMIYSTTYYWQIVPYNGIGPTANCPVWSFTTMADPSITTFPYNEGFEGTFPPAGWLNVHVTGATLTQVWNQAATGTSPACTPHGDAQMARFNSFSFSNGTSAALITPPVTIPAAGYRIGFWMYRDNGYPTYENERVDLLHNTTPDATTATVLGSVHRAFNFDPPVTEAGWYEYQFNIPAEYTGGGHYFMLLGFSQYGNNMFVDDFYINSLPTEPIFVLSPTNNTLNFGTVNVSEISAPLTFTMSNGGVGTVVVNSITLTGPDAAMFSAEIPNMPLNINTGESVPVQVTFAPTTQGDKTATITIIEGPNNTPHEVNLIGIGHDSIIVPPYTQTFTETLFPPLDWTRFSGVLDTTSELIVTTAGWSSDDFANITDPVNKAAKMNIYGLNRAYWLITPPVNLTTTSNVNLEFDLALTDYASTDPATLGEDDKFAVVISTDNGETWSSSNVLQLWTSTTPISNTGDHISISLGTYTGNVKIGFYGESLVSNADNDIFVDNIEFTSGIPFNPPTNLTATPGNHLVSLAWTAPVPAPTDVRNNGHKIQTRTLAGYKVYRDAVLINTQLVTTTNYQDVTAINGTTYSYYVRAAYTNPNGESAPSNTVQATPSGPALNPPTNLQAAVEELVNVHLTWNSPAPRSTNIGPLQKTKYGSQSVRSNNSQKDEVIYNSRNLFGYKVYRNNSLIATLNSTTPTSYDDTNLADGQYSYHVTAVYTNPDGESGPSNTAVVNITGPTPTLVWGDTFEAQEDFALEFAPWTLIDVDQSPTYGFEETTFPNSGSAMAYIVFNPTTTTPAITDIVPHSGNKLAACFAGTVPPNNDWLIAPKIHLGVSSSVNFWARSYTAQYGLERFKVAISTTTTDPAAFTVISPNPYVSAPVVWTEYTYNLAAYNGQDVYIGIQCISNDAFIFFVDDFKVFSNGGYVGNDNHVEPVAKTTLGTNYPNPFNPETTLNYSLKEKGQVNIEVYNLKGQKVRTLVNEVMNAGEHRVNWNGKDNNNNTVASGVYFFKMKSGKFSSSRKVILMK